MKVLFILVIATFATTVLSLECPSCRGSECLEPQTVFTECSREVASLPFGYESNSLNRGAEKLGCISLEYEMEPEIRYFVKQCFLIPESDLCESISSSLLSSVTMRNCEFYTEDEVQSFEPRIYKRDTEVVLPYEEGSGDDTTTTDPTTTGDPITSDTTDPSNENSTPTEAPTTTPADNDGVAGIAVSVFVLVFTCLVQCLV